MNRSPLIFRPMLLLCAAFCMSASTYAQEDAKVDFVRDIKPIFESKCLRCHGPSKAEGFRIDVTSEAMDYVTAGDASESDLYNYLISEDEAELMPPPEENDPLTEEQIALVKRWIDEGAAWPDGVLMQEPQPQNQNAPAAASVDDSPGPPQRKGAQVENLTLGQKIWKAIGALHPASVHLPLGLLMAAGLFALLGLTGSFAMSDTAYYCLWLGALTAVFASIFGWSQSINLGGPADLTALTQPDTRHYWHRLSGVGVTLFALLLALYAARARSLDPDNGTLWKLGAILLAVAVSYCGYEGGKITHKSGHYNYLISVFNEVMGWDKSSKSTTPSSSDANPSADQVGRTSQELDDAAQQGKDNVRADVVQ